MVAQYPAHSKGSVNITNYCKVHKLFLNVTGNPRNRHCDSCLNTEEAKAGKVPQVEGLSGLHGEC